MLGPRDLLLLDTSVLVHVSRNDSTGKAIQDEYKLTTRTDRPLISTIAEGEVFAFAKYRNWGTRRLNALSEIVSQLVRVEASLPQVIEFYSELSAYSKKHGLPRGQNDLWIAASAKAANAILITCDKDFDGLQQAGLIQRIYISDSTDPLSID